MGCRGNGRVNMIAPWFTDTAIIEPLTRLGLIGLPMCDINDVVNAAICAASDPSRSGLSSIPYLDVTGSS